MQIQYPAFETFHCDWRNARGFVEIDREERGEQTIIRARDEEHGEFVAITGVGSHVTVITN